MGAQVLQEELCRASPTAAYHATQGAFKCSLCAGEADVGGVVQGWVQGGALMIILGVVLGHGVGTAGARRQHGNS